ncbi:DNA photolyase [Methylicorpusculum oleiharenae]|uniref:SPL family radical SAM protein n=1 Tax=Methylicorpusculum oleiharenae TaxID=1338687 RepID=UPI001358A2D9|nr:DNA photolyase [Methylicorpusculum oleiharenae]MCD2449549.1 DNA photolyase [Methylicorpusculum oleiharenae]
MIDTIYIEESIANHPRVDEICARFPNARKIGCQRYGEVFNPRAQNFRLQKLKPALILAEKYQRFVLEAPGGYGIGAQKNYYFSHMLNCLYDCRYCFLQGMYQSAHFVLFVNYEDYQQEILRISQSAGNEMTHFFSGYDCDSLALEPVTGFAESFLPVFETLPNAWLELRTKSTQVRTLLERRPHPRCVVAFSLSPDSVAKAIEDKAPSLDRRLIALSKLQTAGWPIGLRFDPLIYYRDFKSDYRQFFERVFSIIELNQLHSVSLGVFRLPEHYFKKMHKLYPEEKLFSGPLISAEGKVSYPADLELDMIDYCRDELLKFIPEEKYFPCQI